MRNLNDTLQRLASFRSGRRTQMEEPGVDRLTDLDGFGPNPGALRARTYLPRTLPRSAPLVVVLHGCTQTAADYDNGSGWSQLADQQGFALLFPEQQRANNANLCFNWFAPGDIRRNGGEAASIVQMTEAVAAAHGVDRRRVFITGLSAGGAMALAMLAVHPELFAGGAIIAGLPFGCASTVPEAFDRMRGHGCPGEAALQALLRNASNHQGRWPILSIWHGTADRTVDPANAAAIIAQWRAVHGVNRTPDVVTAVGGYPRRVWLDGEGREVIEEYTITRMGHGTPLATGGADGIGASGPFMLEMGISSTRQIARFWGLARAAEARSVQADMRQPMVSGALALAGSASQATIEAPGEETPPPAHPAHGPRKIIEDALRAAGLMQ